MSITLTDAEKIAENAAEKALRNLLISLGMDASNPLELQRDFHFLRATRLEATDTARAIRKKVVDYVLIALFAGSVAVSTPPVFDRHQAVDRPRDLPANTKLLGAQP